MSTDNWEFGASGSWTDASKWSLGAKPTAGDDVTIDAVGTYAVTLSAGGVANSLTFDAVNATLSELTTGSFTIGGQFELDAGTAILRNHNSFGSVLVDGGVLQAYKGTSLGSGGVTLDGGELTGMATETIANELSIGSTGTTIDAATGDTVNFGGNDWFLDTTSSPTIQFGSATRKGTVVWHTPFAVISVANPYTVVVAGGTLRAADVHFDFILANDSTTTIATGATIDLNGFSAHMSGLQGGGDIVNHAASAALILNGGGTYSGVISGAIGVEIAGSTEFESAQTYANGTTIDAGYVLVTNVHGAVTGVIVDNGALANYDATGTFTAGPISGTGMVYQVGAGTLVLDQAGSYTGGTYIDAGKVEVGVGSALGTGLVTIDNAELIGTASETLAVPVTFQGNTTVAASTGATVNINGGVGEMTWDATSAPLNLTFGDAAHKGVVEISYGGGTENYANPIHVKVADGTLKAGDGALGFFFSQVAGVSVSAGAKLDLGGQSVFAPSLTCAGSIINSSAALATLGTVNTSSVTGTISGKIAVDVGSGALTLTGADTYTGGTTIASGATLQLGNNGATGSITGVISGAGALIIDETGVVTLAGANTYSGGTTLLHGKLTVTNGKALGTGAVTLDSGTLLLASQTMTLGATETGALTFSGTTTIAAAHGKTLIIGGGGVDVNKGVMNFGAAGDDGTVVFKVAGGPSPQPFSMKINFGTLKAGDAVFSDLAIAATSVTVAAGATLDLGGYDVYAKLLEGGGTVTDTGAKNILGDFGGLFTGNLTGALEFAVGGAVTLTGANTYTGGTVISSATLLQLGDGGATGSITGNIVDDGVLAVDESGKVTLAGLISGSGSITQKGTGATTLSHSNSFTGGVAIAHGELIAATGAALGAGGAITMTGGELLATATESLNHNLVTGGSDTIAVATGKILTLATANDTLDAGTLYFGDSADKGTVIYKTSGTFTFNDAAHTKVQVRDGVLKAGDTDGLLNLLVSVAGVSIDTGATIDAGGHALDIDVLTGSGTLTNTGAAIQLILVGGTTFSGVLAGRYTEVDLYNTVTLSGNETFTGPAVIENGTVTLSGLFAEAVEFNGGGTLVLTTPSHFTGKLEDFQSGSTIDLRNITKGAGSTVSYDAGTGVLTVSDGTRTDKLTFSGSYSSGNFEAVSDGSGGTDIDWQVVAAAPLGTSAAPLASAMAGFGATSAPTAANMAHAAPVSPLAALAAHG